MNEEMYMLFENYLNNSLATNEKLDFETKLKSDADFFQNFETYKENVSFLETKFGKESTAFKQNLKAISDQNFKSKPQVSTRVIAFRPWHYAAAAAVVLFFGLWFWQGGMPTYEEYNQHEKAAFVERGATIKQLKVAQQAFNDKNYAVAIVTFERILKEDNSPEIRYFYGISLLENNQFKTAETTFKTLYEGTSIYKYKALWYLALSKLKQNKTAECKAILVKIPEEAEDYEKAQKLITDLE